MAALFIAITVVPGALWAQAKPKKLSEELSELSAKVDEAMKNAVEGAAAAKALQELMGKVTALRRKVEALEQRGQGYDGVRAKVEQFDGRLGALELDLAALKMQAGEEAATSGFNDGFFLQSKDRKYMLRIGGMAQTGYSGTIFADETLGTGETVGENSSTMFLRRARLAASGHVINWRLSYRMELDFGSEDPGTLLEGWGEAHVHRLFRLRAGRMKIPYGRQFIVHSAYQQFVERSGATRAFAHGWDLGAMVLGNVPLAGVWSYQLGIFNGAGSYATQDDNTDFLYAARLLYQPLGPVDYAEGDVEVGKLQIAVGGAFTYNLARTDIAARKGVTDPAKAAALADADADGNVDNVSIYQLGAELVARMGGLALQSELFYRLEDPGAVGDDRILYGLYTQASFFHFDSSLELALRYGFWEPSYYGVAYSTEMARPEQVHSLEAVLNGMVWQRRVKWQIQYAHEWLTDLFVGDKTLGTDVEVDRVTLQAQLAF